MQALTAGASLASYGARGVALVAAAALLPALAPAPARAQGAAGAGDSRAAMEACLDAIPKTALTRVPVYLEAEVSEPAHRVILPGADVLADLVARRVRARLTADAAGLPAGEPVVAWRELDRSVEVTVARDGDFTWRVVPADSLLRPASAPSPAAELVASALAAARAEGERLPWPDGAAGNSIEFRLQFTHATPRLGGAVEPARLRVAIPVFSLAVPWVKPVAVTRPPKIAYPEKLARAGVTGTIILNYVVGADGRVAPGTLSDVWNSPEPYPRGADRQAYRDFIATVRRALPAARFEPARMGGCAVPQLVQQPFVFGIR